MENEFEEHDAIEREILEVLKENIGNKPINAHSIKKYIDAVISQRKVESYLLILIDKGIVCIKKEKISGYGENITYYLSNKGIEYVRNNYKDKERNVDKIVNELSELTEQLTKVGENSNEVTEEYMQRILDKLELIRINTDDKGILKQIGNETKNVLISQGAGYAIGYLVQSIKAILK